MTIKMEIGIRYIVTKASDDQTFELGDHINMTENGEIYCIEAMGWVIASDVPSAIKGMEIMTDGDWIDSKRKKLLAELDVLDKSTKVT